MGNPFARVQNQNRRSGPEVIISSRTKEIDDCRATNIAEPDVFNGLCLRRGLGWEEWLVCEGWKAKHQSRIEHHEAVTVIHTAVALTMGQNRDEPTTKDVSGL
jgi:hypothetical protein